MNSKRKLLILIQGLTSLIVLAALCLGLGKSYESLSPLGQLIAPSSGIWRQQPTTNVDVEHRLKSALKDAGLAEVRLQFDEFGVPHLESKNEEALYFSQGFVTAYFRIWQMDFLSRITAGRVAELVGEKALPVDRFFRRLRVPAAARASSEMMMNDPVTRGPISAYARGVNARIGQIDIASLPIEYRLFGLFPEPWAPERAAYLLKYMTWELTGYLYDFRMTATKSKLSAEVFDLLFPLSPKRPGTIIRGAGDSEQDGMRKTVSHDLFQPAFKMAKAFPPAGLINPAPSNGSNNWAIPARMMSNGRALLSNDLHLSYTLPALWFPIQMTSPSMNVYGASLPGAPGIVVGFTESMGWAVTNGTDDVLDWYSLRFRDQKRQEYLFEEDWRPVVSTEEEIKLPDGRSEIVRTRETHFGPIVFDEGDLPGVIEIPTGLAMQWTGLIPSNEVKTFLLLNRGTKAADCLDALKSYVAPGQNFVCADRSGKIAYKHAGLFPDRRGRDGRVVTEVSHSGDLWQGYLAPDVNPVMETTTEPIVTANQPPFNGAKLSDLGWFFATPYRAIQIRALIDSKAKSSRISPEEVIAMQSDKFNRSTLDFHRMAISEFQHPPLKDVVNGDQCVGRVGDFLQTDDFKTWNGDHSAESLAATAAYDWFTTFEYQVWATAIGEEETVYWPNRWQLLDMTRDAATWQAVSPQVTLNERLAEALKKSCAKLNDLYGSVPVWSRYQVTTIRHSGRLPGLGRTDIKAGGSGDSVFANKGNHGPVWKMIVSFEDTPKAWNMIPGGQSGDPLSRDYDSAIADWAEGKMNPVRFHKRTMQ